MSHTRCAHDTVAIPNGNDRIACDRLRVHLDVSRRSRCVLSIWRRRSDMLSRRLLLVQPAHDVGLPCGREGSEIRSQSRRVEPRFTGRPYDDCPKLFY